MTLPRRTATVLVVGAVALALLSWGTRGHRAANRATTRADSLAAEILLERARADDWEARAADTTAALLELLAATDSQAARLARELEAARARPVSRTVVIAEASGTVETPAVTEPDSVTAEIQDGPLTARLAYFPAPQFFRLDWSAEISAELVHVVAPDRRLLVFARSPDPRVRLSVPTLEYQIPDPERPGFPWRWIGVAAVGGYLLGRQ